jgi:Lrp/AsnC family leucine-responsive transcriptional regulator
MRSNPAISNRHLDQFDREILAILQEDGRASNQDVADKIGLSPTPCLRRIRRLEAEGVISGYAALVRPDAVGLTVSAFIRVRLDQQGDRHLVQFEEVIATFPEVMECYLMSGDADYQLRIQVQSLPAFEDFLRAKLTKVPGVAQVTTSFALRPVVYKTALPIGE